MRVITRASPFESRARSYKLNYGIDFHATLELTNQISHVTILVSLVGQSQRKVQFYAKISFVNRSRPEE